jgi:hypothetical protein
VFTDDELSTIDKILEPDTASVDLWRDAREGAL